MIQFKFYNKIMATISLFSFQQEDQQYQIARNRGLKAQQMSTYLTSSKYSSSDSEEEDHIAHQTHIVRNLMLKQSFKSFISNVLTQRKAIDLNQSCIQVASDHKVFKVFQAWKRLKDQSTHKKAEVQFIIDRKLFEKKRTIFKTWANLVINSKKADLHFLGNMFGKLKDICSAELLTRLKKIELTTWIQKKNIKKILNCLREDRQLSDTQLKKADLHDKLHLKQKIFSSFTTAIQSLKKDNLKYHQFKMAHLFHKHILFRKYFNLLLIPTQNHFYNT